MKRKTIMKKITKAALLLAALLPLAYACQEKIDPEEEKKEEEKKVDPVSLPLTFVLPSTGAKTAWVAGDQIVVHGEYAKDQVTVTLSAADISGDGKTASLTVDGLYPYVREDCASTLYASWPASAVDNLKHCFFYSKFSTTGQLLLAACNDADNKFQFQEVGGVLRFTTGGESFESFTLAGNKKENVGFGFLQVKITDKDQNFRQYMGDPLIQLDLEAKTENLVYMPAGTEIKAGIMIKFRQNGKFVKAFKSKDAFKIERGQVLDLGDISADIAKYDDPFSADIMDLDEVANANCYIIPAAGGYKFKAVYGNLSTQFIEDIASADVLWETWNNAEEVTPNSVIASASYAEDYVIVHTPATLHPGNAVVAVRDDSGKILWSWHLWVPATAVATASYGAIMGPDVMDRNLGALVATVAGDTPIDPTSYGMVYQWGRKDPFTAAGSFNSGTQATWAGEDEVVAPGQISLEDAIAQPRLLGHIDNGNWMNDLDETLWNGADGKTIYDPCPPGYRVPVRNSNPFWSANLSTAVGWAIDNANGWLTIGDPVAVFPIAGYRDDYSVGGMAKVGTRTLYWNATGSESKAGGADLRYDKGTYAGTGSAPKARLGSVRCVVE